MVFFINTLFLENEEKSICFLKEAKYFHRKRQNLSSLTDKYWEVEERYKDCLQFGSLRLLDLSTNGNRRVPPPPCISNIQFFMKLTGSLQN